ncbi:PD-(D/E)XK nuclease superfamily [Longilinea arvoryzae]|uniref:PD-(D/E)XK nuclease superfamily n=1 Tax=Longilinea arvoryzae TaxID=360412 RepID=A0A0S7BBK2_9CHLR|nr:PD-(D/E)XK nuclease family protein [Longilinea arvoryzae]GAP15022.1 PD-(D/E)XK nuclease superfamily [Longilinea arvoryzae]
MPISPDFSFSQNNLQDYLDCPRRFQLRYLERMAWPAVQSEPILEQEHHMQLGESFHQLVQQHQLGLPTEVLETTAGSDPDLLDWWQAYLQNLPQDLPPVRKIEYTLSAPFAGFRLLAKYDLLAIEPGRQILIVDWKTSRRRPSTARLRERVQSRLYPFLVVLAGAHLNGGIRWQPEQVELIYWFTAEPHKPLHLPYSAAQYAEDEKLLSAYIDAIRRSADQVMTLTGDIEHQCRLCNFRSFCKRGDRAGEWDEETADAEPSARSDDFDFGQIEEIEF